MLWDLPRVGYGNCHTYIYFLFIPYFYFCLCFLQYTLNMYGSYIGGAQ